MWSDSLGIFSSCFDSEPAAATPGGGSEESTSVCGLSRADRAAKKKQSKMDDRENAQKGRKSQLEALESTESMLRHVHVTLETNENNICKEYKSWWHQMKQDFKSEADNVQKLSRNCQAQIRKSDAAIKRGEAHLAKADVAIKNVMAKRKSVVAKADVAVKNVMAKRKSVRESITAAQNRVRVKVAPRKNIKKKLSQAKNKLAANPKAKFAKEISKTCVPAETKPQAKVTPKAKSKSIAKARPSVNVASRRSSRLNPTNPAEVPVVSLDDNSCGSSSGSKARAVSVAEPCRSLVAPEQFISAEVVRRNSCPEQRYLFRNLTLEEVGLASPASPARSSVGDSGEEAWDRLFEESDGCEFQDDDILNAIIS